jgi:hypothetical protein
MIKLQGKYTAHHFVSHQTGPEIGESAFMGGDHSVSLVWYAPGHFFFLESRGQAMRFSS